MKLTLGCVAQPGTSRQSLTGRWRTGQRPRFLRIKCTACELCALCCPDGCIYGHGRNTYFADLNYCKGCGICATVCPVDDIEMVAEEIPVVSPGELVGPGEKR